MKNKYSRKQVIEILNKEYNKMIKKSNQCNEEDARVGEIVYYNLAQGLKRACYLLEKKES